MITTADIVYYSFYILCLCFSFLKTRTIRGIILLRSVLVLGIVNEGIVELRQYMNIEENFSHFLYIPAEYCLMTLFYSLQTENKYLKSAMLLSVPVYLAEAFFMAFKVYHFSGYPSNIYNLDCFFSIIWVTLVMFNFKILENIPILKMPVFWIFSGALIFYSGVYFFNIAYNYLLLDNSFTASEIRMYINLGLNIILYTFWTYAFICSAKIKSYMYH